MPGYVPLRRLRLHLPRLAIQVALGESASFSGYAVGRRYVQPALVLKALVQAWRAGAATAKRLQRDCSALLTSPWVRWDDVTDPVPRLAKAFAEASGWGYIGLATEQGLRLVDLERKSSPCSSRQRLRAGMGRRRANVVSPSREASFLRLVERGVCLDQPKRSWIARLLHSANRLRERSRSAAGSSPSLLILTDVASRNARGSETVEQPAERYSIHDPGQAPRRADPGPQKGATCSDPGQSGEPAQILRCAERGCGRPGDAGCDPDGTRDDRREQEHRRDLILVAHEPGSNRWRHPPHHEAAEHHGDRADDGFASDEAPARRRRSLQREAAATG